MSDDSQRWTRKDFINFSIEDIWKEMEEINRARKATQDIFQQFQDNFFDRTESSHITSQSFVQQDSPIDDFDAQSIRSEATSVAQSKRKRSTGKLSSQHQPSLKKPFNQKPESFNNLKVTPKVAKNLSTPLTPTKKSGLKLKYQQPGQSSQTSSQQAKIHVYKPLTKKQQNGSSATAQVLSSSVVQRSTDSSLLNETQLTQQNKDLHNVYSPLYDKQMHHMKSPSPVALQVTRQSPPRAIAVQDDEAWKQTSCFTPEDRPKKDCTVMLLSSSSSEGDRREDVEV